jgi:hypothetical protein
MRTTPSPITDRRRVSGASRTATQRTAVPPCLPEEFFNDSALRVGWWVWAAATTWWTFIHWCKRCSGKCEGVTIITVLHTLHFILFGAQTCDELRWTYIN